MPGLQEILALAIVALVAAGVLWRRHRGRARNQSAACGDCTSSGPPPKEATLHFYRRQKEEGPASGAPDDES